MSVSSAEEHTLELIVTEREPLADGVVRLTSANTDGGELPEWAARAP